MTEEKINVFFKGEILQATKKYGTYSIDLPGPSNLKRVLFSTDEGWEFSETEIDGSTDSYFWMRMNNDGSVTYANDMTDSVKTIETHYHPDFSDLGNLNNLGKEMYGIIQQLEGYEKLGISPSDILDLRKKILGLSLTMLGYDNVNSIFYTDPNPDESIMDLNHTIQYLEKYPALAQYVTRMKYSGVDTVIVNTPPGFSQEQLKMDFEQAQEDYNKETAYVSERLYEIRRRRDEFVLPDFCKGLKPFLQKRGGQRKGEPTSWDEYSETTRNLAKLVLGFNSDLLPAHERMRVVQSTSLNDVELLHHVSLLTEPAEMDEVLAEESYFFIHESERLAAKVKKDLADERTSDSTPGVIMKGLVEETSQEAEERMNAIQNRYYYRNVYPYDKTRKIDFGKKSKKLDEERGFFD